MISVLQEWTDTRNAKTFSTDFAASASSAEPLVSCTSWGSFGSSCSTCVLDSLLLPGACRINANQCDPARESASSQAVTTEPAVCRLPKDTFIMHAYFGLEGQKSCSSLCQLIRKSIDRFAGVGWCFWVHTCLSVSNNPGARGRSYTPHRVNKEFHQTRTRTGESCPPVHLCLACLSQEIDSVMREQCGHL